MGVYELSGAGSVKTGRTLYTSMNAGNQYGAMVPIASVTLAVAADPISFTNIPQIYQDLMFVINARGTKAATLENLVVYPNGLGGTTNASDTRLIGDGSSATSVRSTNQPYNFLGNIPSASSTAGIFGATEVHVLNYTNTTTFKTFLNRSASDLNGSGNTILNVGLWRSTAAITSFDIYAESANYLAGTSITLYGIRAVS
jgi:hypothetical protein